MSTYAKYGTIDGFPPCDQSPTTHGCWQCQYKNYGKEYVERIFIGRSSIAREDYQKHDFLTWYEEFYLLHSKSPKAFPFLDILTTEKLVEPYVTREYTSSGASRP